MNTLNLTAQPITLITPDASHPIALTLNQIQQQLTHYPPSDYAWETAIQTIEDALYPLRDWRQNTQPLAVQGAELLLALPHQTHPHGATQLTVAAANHHLLRRVAAVARMGAPLGLRNPDFAQRIPKGSLKTQKRGDDLRFNSRPILFRLPQPSNAA